MADKPITRNRTVERAALKAISKGLPSSKNLLTRLDESFFGNDVNKIVFKRIKQQLQIKNEIPSWRALTQDPSFSDATKAALQGFTDNVVVNKQTCGEIFDNLYTYRRRRIIDHMSRVANEGLLQGKDEETILAEIANQVALARARKNREKPLALGKGSQYKETMEKVLSGEAIPLWPTGFKDFDERGGGIAVGSLVLLGGYTGGGKSNLLQTLSVNFADYGLRVGEISLEMDQPEVLLRRMSAISNIPQDRILKNQLTEKEKDHIRKSMADRVQTWAKKGSGVYTHTPSHGLTMTGAIQEVEAYGYDVVGLDYISLLEGLDGKDFWRILGECCRLGKLDAKARNGIFIILIQTNKEDEAKLSSFMMTHADYAMFIKYSPDGDNEDFAEIGMPKARKIKKTPFVLGKDFAHGRFTNYTGDYKPGDRETNAGEKPKRVTTQSVRVQGGQGQKRVDVAEPSIEIDPETEAYFANMDDI